MGTVNFNAIPNRRDSESEKWNTYASDVLPMWVADSDYAVADEIIEALATRLQHPVLGYGNSPERLKALIVKRLADLYRWQIRPEWICFIPGVVAGLNSSRAIMGDVGTQAITSIPVYPHLQNVTPILQRGMQTVPMRCVNGRYTPDFHLLDRTINAQTKMLMLCHPHNPVGVVYNHVELQQFADLAEKHDLLICSDDIHADFALYDDKPYQPIATLSPAISKRTITLMAASKTYNIAGLSCAYAIIEEESLRARFTTQLKGLVGDVNILGYLATEAAYAVDNQWLSAQIVHLRNQAEYCYQRINAIPHLSMNAMEATYLAWIDISQIQQAVKDKGFDSVFDYLLYHKVGVSAGDAFGDPQHIRLNLATSREYLIEGLNRIECAIEDL